MRERSPGSLIPLGRNNVGAGFYYIGLCVAIVCYVALL